MRFYRKKSGGLFPPATGSKPFSVGTIQQSDVELKATKRGLSPHSVLYAGYVLMKKKILPKAGGQRYLAIKGHARPMFNLLFFRRFTLTGYFVAVGRIELPLVEYVAIVSQPSQPLCH